MVSFGAARATAFERYRNRNWASRILASSALKPNAIRLLQFYFHCLRLTCRILTPGKTPQHGTISSHNLSKSVTIKCGRGATTTLSGSVKPIAVTQAKIQEVIAVVMTALVRRQVNELGDQLICCLSGRGDREDSCSIVGCVES